MDMYLNLLKWTIDESQAETRLAAIGDVRRRYWYYIVAGIEIFALLLIFIVGAVIGWKLFAMLGLPSLINLVVSIAAGSAAAFGAALLIGLIVRIASRRESGYGAWHPALVARLYDHRIWMVGVGFLTFAISGVLFATAGMQFQPPLNLDFSSVRIGMPPGSTLAQTEQRLIRPRKSS
jgi:multidrug efflux pump subunit AcrB